MALTKVVEGGVAGYYSQFNKVVSGVLDDEPGCDGYFISPLIENPQDQLLLINWKSVDVWILPFCLPDLASFCSFSFLLFDKI